MKKIFVLVTLVTSLIGVTSCDFLDVKDYFEDTLNKDSIFKKQQYLEEYLWGAAALLPNEANIFRSGYYPGILGSDEAFTMWEDSYTAQRFPINAITADNLGSMDIWPNMYMIIRKCNTLFARIDESADLKAQDKRTIIGYAHFLRAYAYYHLLLNYGPLLIVGDDVYETSLPSEAYQKYRSTFDESVEYICKEFETAASYISEIVPVSLFGRPTKGAAYALIARVRVYAASPLYNGGQPARTYFSGFRRQSDNVPYISQTYDEKKWALAAAACKRVMDMGLYELHSVEKLPDTQELPAGIADADFYKNWPSGAAGIDPLRSYAEMFNGETVPFKNKEFIFAKSSPEILSAAQLSFPGQFGGWNGYCIPQKIIDNYRMVDGRDISNSSSRYPYREDYFSTRDSSFSGYTLKSKVNAMYLAREPRFYASVGFSGCLWPMNSTNENGKFLQQVFYSVDGNAGRSAAVAGDIRNYPITGYVSKKYIHPDDAWSGANAARLDKSFPVIRYADILLMYAESLNNLTQSYTITDTVYERSYTFSRDQQEIASAFNAVRYRSGMPGLTPEEVSNPEAFFNALVRERMIEFLHEGLRYFDVRRWGIVAAEEAKPVMGMNTAQTESGGYFNRVICDYPTVRNRIFLPKMILLPIERQEIKRVQTLDQNPGWEK